MKRRGGAAAPDDAPVVARGLTKRYPGGPEAATDVTFTVEEGELVAVMGPNGAGKSTTLNMVATLLRPTAGQAWVCGIPVEERAAARRVLGVALQAAGLDPLMSVADLFRVHASLYAMRGADGRGRAGELMDTFGLGRVADRRAGSLSGGMQRRVALALALVHRPRVVVFDEPTVGLDPTAKKAVWELLQDLRMQGLAILFSTHDMAEAEALSDRILLMSGGRIVTAGTPDAVKASAAQGLLVVRAHAGADLAARAILSAVDRGELPPDVDCAVSGDVVTVRIDIGDPSFVPLLAAVIAGTGAAVADVKWGHGSLDDVFAQLSGSAGGEPCRGVRLEHRAQARRRAR